MAANPYPVYEKDPIFGAKSFTNSDSAGTKKDLVDNSAGGLNVAEGVRVDQVTAVSTDTTARVFNFYQHDGSTSWRLPSVTVPITAGTDGTTAAVDLMAYLAPVLGYIILPPGHKLQVENATQPTSAKQFDITARGGKLTA